MTILYTNNFETALNAGISGNAPTLSTEQKVSGTKSMKSVVDYNNATNAYRCEISSINIGGGSLMAEGATYWLGFALYVPSVYPTSTQGDIFYQVHNTPDQNLGEAYLNPPLALQIVNDQWKWSMLSDNRAVTPKGSYQVSESKYLGTVAKGTWTRFVVQFKIAPSGGGFIRVWINDVQKVNYSGPTFFNDAAGPYNKFGIYRPAWKPGSESWGVIPSELAVFTTRTLYHDDIKIGDAAASYEDVAPSGGSAPVSGGIISSVNSSTNQIAPSVAVNTALGSGLEGVLSATISDTDTTINVSALGYPTGNQVDFDTDALTGISTPASLKFQLAPIAKFDVNPRVWGDNFNSSTATVSNYNTTVGPFNSGRTITLVTGTNWVRSHEDTGVAVTAGDVLDIWYYMTAGTGGKAMVGSVIGAAGNENKMDFRGSLSGDLPAISGSQTAGTSSTCTTETSGSYPSLKIVKVRYTAGATGNLWVGIGPGSSDVGDSVNELGVRIWKNADSAITEAAFTVDVPSALPEPLPTPTVTSVSAMNQGDVATISGTNLKAATGVRLDTGASIITVDEFVASSDGTAINFRVPFSVPVGAVTVLVDYSPYCSFSNDAMSWGDNAGDTLSKVAYTTATWMATQGATVSSSGSAWHRTSRSTISALAGATLTVDTYFILGSSGKAQINIRNVNAASNITLELVNDILDVTASQFGTLTSYSKTTINGLTRVRVSLVNDVTSSILVGIGPLSSTEGGSVIAQADRTYSGYNAATLNTAGTVGSPSSQKVIQIGTSASRIKRNGVNGNFTYTVVGVYEENLLLNPAASPVVILENVAVVDGLASANESNVVPGTGSLNTLPVGLYWVLSARPSTSGFGYSMSYGQRLLEQV